MATFLEKLNRWFWLLVSCLGVLVTAGLASANRPPDRPSTGECWNLAAVPGPEDVVIAPEGDVALVSSQDRRGDAKPPDAIWKVPLDRAAAAEEPRRLTLRGRDGCSFHPHGIDLVKNRQGKLLLYVLNHHDPEDLTVAQACFDAVGKTEPRASVTSVEVFEYRDGELHFLQRLADPEILTGGNDLVAENDGDLWVTIPPRGVFGILAERAGGHRSKLVHFDCERAGDRDARCTGAWSEVDLAFREPPRYANGIEIDSDIEPSRLYLASSIDERILVAEIEGDGVAESGGGERAEGIPTLRELGFHCVGGKPDNLGWSDGGQLLVAVHADTRRYLQHSLSSSTPSPWKLFALSADQEPRGTPCAKRKLAAPVLEDAGGRVSAASVAASIGGDYIVGQVYGPGVVRCRPDASASATGGTR